MSKSIIILGIICLIAASIVVGFLVWSITQPCTQPASQQQVVGGEDIDISDWLTYRNEEHGFVFKYPGDWTYEILSDGRIGLYPPGKSRGYEYVGDIIIDFEENKSNLTILQYKPAKKYKIININNFNVYWLENWPGIIESDLYFFRLNGYIIEIVIYNDKNNITQGIISTFNIK